MYLHVWQAILQSTPASDLAARKMYISHQQERRFRSRIHVAVCTPERNDIFSFVATAHSLESFTPTRKRLKTRLARRYIIVDGEAMKKPQSIADLWTGVAPLNSSRVPL